MPTRAAASAFSPSPSLNRKPRREDVSLHIASALRPARNRPTMPDEPRYEVRNLLGRERLPRQVVPPVGLAQVRSPSNHRGSQGLIAHQREIRRIHDRAHRRPTLALRSMAPRAGAGKDDRTSLSIPGAGALAGTLVGRQRRAGHGAGPRPAGEHPLDQRVDLRVCQIAPCAGPERWHRGARHPLADDRAESVRRHQGQVDGIVERPGGAEATTGTVTARAVTSVEHVERRHLRRHDLTVRYRRAPGQGITGGEAETDDDRDGSREETRKGVHRSISWGPRSRDPFAPEALTPARAASGHDCMVATGCARDTTYPAASPNAIWETTNQVQSTRAFRVGLMTPSTAQSPPVHSSGATRPPQSTCRPGSVGRITA